MKQSTISSSYYRYVMLLALGLALLALVLSVRRAAAHSPELVKSDPPNGAVLKQAPTQVTAWFSEELITGQSTLQVFDSTGRQVDNGDGGVDLNDPDHASMIVKLPALPNGAYAARWQVVLEDGDTTDGEFTFSVGEAAPIATRTPASERAPANDGFNWPVGGIMVSLGALLIILIIGLILRSRSARDN